MTGVSEAIRTALLKQKDERVEDGLYWETQIAFAYDSNRIGQPSVKEADAEHL